MLRAAPTGRSLRKTTWRTPASAHPRSATHGSTSARGLRSTASRSNWPIPWCRRLASVGDLWNYLAAWADKLSMEGNLATKRCCTSTQRETGTNFCTFPLNSPRYTSPDALTAIPCAPASPSGNRLTTLPSKS